jgi:hypothetical protein
LTAASREAAIALKSSQQQVMAGVVPICVAQHTTLHGGGCKLHVGMHGCLPQPNG